MRHLSLEVDEVKLAAQEAQRNAMANLRTQKINRYYELLANDLLKKNQLTPRDNKTGVEKIYIS